MKMQKIKLEELNLEELTSEEMMAITGGQFGPENSISEDVLYPPAKAFKGGIGNAILDGLERLMH